MTSNKYDVNTYAEGEEVHLRNKAISLTFIKSFVGDTLENNNFDTTYIAGNREDKTPGILIRLPLNTEKEKQEGVLKGLTKKLKTEVKTQFDNQPLKQDVFIRIDGYPTDHVKALKETDPVSLKNVENSLKQIEDSARDTGDAKLKISSAISVTLAVKNLKDNNLNTSRTI